jgi:hypothetical protein
MRGEGGVAHLLMGAKIGKFLLILGQFVELFSSTIHASRAVLQRRMLVW